MNMFVSKMKKNVSFLASPLGLLLISQLICHVNADMYYTVTNGNRGKESTTGGRLITSH